MNNKNRNCIICNSNQSILVDKEKLEVLGIGKIEIGVSICKKCGCVFQNPYVPKNIMRKFYEEFSNYTNAETGFKPSKERISNITEQIKFCLQNIQDKENAFQLGCSNGFTLSVLKSQGWNVKGIDPSPICKKLAKKNYGINIFSGFYEDLNHNKKYRLFVLTHVLEHIYEPKKILQKISGNIKDDGYLFVEVPCLENEEKWPNGYFSFEHIQFFSEVLLVRLLEKCGFEVLTTRHIFHNYPIISLVCKKSISRKTIIENQFNKNKGLVDTFLKRQKILWNQIEKKINNSIIPQNRVFVWGAGIHTSKLFYRTNILEKIPISAIIDNDSQKQGLFLNKIKVKDVKKIDFVKGDNIIISSHASQEQIYNKLEKLRKCGINVIRLYN